MTLCLIARVARCGEVRVPIYAFHGNRIMTPTVPPSALQCLITLTNSSSGISVRTTNWMALFSLNSDFQEVLQKLYIFKNVYLLNSASTGQEIQNAWGVSLGRRQEDGWSCDHAAMSTCISLETTLSCNTNLKQQRQVKVKLIKRERKTNHLSHTERSASFSE